MIKVFLVEDEAVIREGLKDSIPWEEYGYRFVGAAADGEIALPLIRKMKPDVLITDIKMPFMDGLSLSKIVHSEFSKMKIIIISGYDDFEYARQAIEVGVEQYLLKPITKLTLKKTLLELKEKIESEQQQRDYQIIYRNEMHEYEQFSRRRFFERILGGELLVQEIYEEAAKQSIEIDASCYNLILFFIQEKNKSHLRQEKEEFLIRQEEILHYFLRHPQYILFRNHVNSYGVLVKTDHDQIHEMTQKGVDFIQTVCSKYQDQICWYVATGSPVERLSMLPECYQGVNHCYAYRFLLPDVHILDNDTLKEYLNIPRDNKLNFVDSQKMDPEIIRDFLTRGSSREINEFVNNYLQNIHDALESSMFRNYVVLNIRFTVIAFLESIGIERQDYTKRIEGLVQERTLILDEIRIYFIGMLETAMYFRNKERDTQSKSILKKALDCIHQNFDKETISLNEVAKEVEVSTNYLSAIFSQTMKKTFVEYITGMRMEKAKKLLRTTEKTASDISLEVGYRDPHYFSFVFKKTQGCSPKEYRNGKRS